MRILLKLLLFVVLLESQSWATTYYVNKNGTNVSPYSSNATGANKISTVLTYIESNGTGTKVIYLDADDTYNLTPDSDSIVMAVPAFDNTTIIGNGASIIDTTSSNSNLIYVGAIASAITVTISGINLDVEPTNTGIYLYNSIFTLSSSTVTTANGNPDTLIYSNATTTISVTSCNFTEVGTYSDTFSFWGPHSTFSNNYVSINSGSEGAGFWLGGTNGTFIFSNNIAYFGGQALGFWISLGTPSTVGIGNAVFSNSTIATTNTFDSHMFIDSAWTDTVSFTSCAFNFDKLSGTAAYFIQSEWDDGDGAKSYNFTNCSITAADSDAASIEDTMIFGQSTGGVCNFVNTTVTLGANMIGVNGCCKVFNGIKIYVPSSSIAVYLDKDTFTSWHRDQTFNNCIFTSTGTHTNDLIHIDLNDADYSADFSKCKFNFRYTTGKYPINLISAPDTTISQSVIDALAGYNSNTIVVDSTGTVNFINNDILRSQSDIISVNSGTVNVVNNILDTRSSGYTVRRVGGLVSVVNNFLVSPSGNYLTGTITDIINIKRTENLAFQNYTTYNYHIKSSSEICNQGMDQGYLSDYDSKPLQRRYFALGAYECLRSILKGGMM